MKYVKLGNSGLKVSQICIGTWFLPLLPEKDEYSIYKVDKETALKILKRAYDKGINFIDTANVYHGALWVTDPLHVGFAERVVGEFLSHVDRESVVVSTKVRGQMATWVNGEGLSRKHIMWQVRESLKRLNTSYIDLYFLHWPDYDTPKLETLRTLNDLVRNGLVYYLGISNHPAHDIVEFMELAEKHNLEKFTTIQDLYNMLERYIEKDKVYVSRKYNLAIMAYAPLAHGFLTGKYVDFDKKTWKVDELTRVSMYDNLKSRYFSDLTLKVLVGLYGFARERGLSLSQLAIAWLLRKGEELGVNIIPIVGVTRMEYLDDVLGSLSVNLSSDDMKRIDEILNGKI